MEEQDNTVSALSSTQHGKTLLHWNIDHFFIFAMIDLKLSKSHSIHTNGEDTGLQQAFVFLAS
jgi:hypothetical protein